MLSATCLCIGCMWTLPKTICCQSRHWSNMKSTDKRGFGNERSTNTTGHPRFGSIASTWSAQSQYSTGTCFLFYKSLFAWTFQKNLKTKTTFFLFIFRCMTYLKHRILSSIMSLWAIIYFVWSPICGIFLLDWMWNMIWFELKFINLQILTRILNAISMKSFQLIYADCFWLNTFLSLSF